LTIQYLVLFEWIDSLFAHHEKIKLLAHHNRRLTKNKLQKKKRQVLCLIYHILDHAKQLMDQHASKHIKLKVRFDGQIGIGIMLLIPV
jgi:hypothetical protein